MLNDEENGFREAAEHLILIRMKIAFSLGVCRLNVDQPKQPGEN